MMAKVVAKPKAPAITFGGAFLASLVYVGVRDRGAAGFGPATNGL